MRPYSNDLRERIIQAYRNGEGSLRVLAKRFSVSLNCVWLLLQRFRDTGSVDPKPHGGGPPVLMTEDRLAVFGHWLNSRTMLLYWNCESVSGRKQGCG